MSVRWSRSPAVLMTAYVALYVYEGPWVWFGNGQGRNLVDIIIAVVLAGLASRGFRVARMLVLCFTVLGVLLTLLGTVTSSPAAAASELGDFVCLAVQICLLVSTPMYDRTRPGWSPGRPATGSFLHPPRLWMVLTGLAAGAAITLLSWFAGRILWIGPGRPPSLSPLAPHGGIQAVAFAAGWAEWGLAVLLALYLVWLRNRRESVPVAPWPPAPPSAPTSL